MQYLGGCFFGELRFRSTSGPVETGYCHCSVCRKTTGAPMLAFASFPIENFAYTKGEPRVFESSKHGQREFCGNCGTQICFRESEMAKTVDVNSGALDEVSLVYVNALSTAIRCLNFCDPLFTTTFSTAPSLISL